jgi:protein SCO1/2
MSDRRLKEKFAKMRSSCYRWVIISGLLTAAVGQGQFARPTITRGVDLKQKLNAQIPLDLVFKDETGQALPLRTYFGDKPVLLSLVYFKCASVCPMSMRETTLSLSRLPLKPGTDYNVLIVSFDPQDTPTVAAEQKLKYSQDFHRAGFGAGFHFLTGSQDAISKLTDAVGWKYVWDERTKQFAHAAGIMIATPEGRLSRYFYGMQYASADIRMGLVEAAKDKIAAPADYILLFCFHWDEHQGKYTLAITNILKLAGGITVLLLAGFIFMFMRNDKQKQSAMHWKKVPHVG